MNRYLIAILILAAFLRLWKLGSVPPSASMDEASVGWNAYSVLKTGVDEYGEFPLISQRGYDDWRRSTYLFLTIPFIAFFDLQVISIRLPAVILSLFTIWATYHIVLRLFSKDRIAILSALLLAISPWHIYISRLGHESNAYLSFFVFGVLFFLESRWFVAIVFFTLSMMSYYAGQVLVPLFGLGLLIIYRDSFKKFVVPIMVSVPFLVPIFWTIFSPSAMVRFQGTSAFDFTQKKITNGKILMNNYLSHFRPTWLFPNSGSESFKVPNLGLLYVWELPFIVIGIISLLRRRDVDHRAKKLIFLWFFLAPLPASIATQAPHAMRSYASVVPWQIITALGLYWTVSNLKIPSFIIALTLLLVSLRLFYPNYFIVFPREQSDSFHFALSKALPNIFSREQGVNKIVFSNKDNLYQSYMLYLYYRHFDPFTYQRMGGTKSGGFAETHAIGKYEFRPINWSNEEPGLYVGNVSEFPDGVTGIGMTNKTGKEVIKIVERK